jgi:hypothetical protein
MCLLRAHAALGDSDAAFEAFQFGCDNGCMPNRTIFIIMFRCVAADDTPNVERLIHLLAYMASQKPAIHPNMNIVESLIAGFVKAEQFSEAVKLFVRSAVALVTFISVLCTLRTQISRSVCNAVSTV